MIELIIVWVGFLMAVYSVVANDAVQTLGTFMVSNHKIKWKYLWAYCSLIVVVTLSYAWLTTGGEINSLTDLFYHRADVSYGRLNKIPYINVQWYHALAPLILLVLTRLGVPVSTSFLILSSFASSDVVGKMLYKSILGYTAAAVMAYVIWLAIARWLDSRPKNSEYDKYWRIAQWFSSGFLFHIWIIHDAPNCLVFLPRGLDLPTILIVQILFVAGLAYIFKEKGGKIQNVIIQKHNTHYVRSATIVDFVYALILLYFKYYNDVPMSTTWVFLGLLAGREFGIATMLKTKKIKHVFPLIGKDALKMIVGLAASVGVVLLIHNGA